MNLEHFAILMVKVVSVSSLRVLVSKVLMLDTLSVQIFPILLLSEGRCGRLASHARSVAVSPEWRNSDSLDTP